MSTVTIVCARCTLANLGSNRFCAGCGLPIGGVQPDAGAAAEALGPYEAPDPADPDVDRAIREFVERAGFELAPARRGWQVVIPARLDRKQAVYVGPGGVDAEGRALVSFVSVCGPVNDRDCRILLKQNARMTDGCFAIRVLRGEEYFVFVENLHVSFCKMIDAARLLQRIAELADGFEDRMSRGRDLF